VKHFSLIKKKRGNAKEVNMSEGRRGRGRPRGGRSRGRGGRPAGQRNPLSQQSDVTTSDPIEVTMTERGGRSEGTRDTVLLHSESKDGEGRQGEKRGRSTVAQHSDESINDFNDGQDGEERQKRDKTKPTRSQTKT